MTATALVNASMTPALMRDMSTLYLVHQKDGQARFVLGFDWSHTYIADSQQKYSNEYSFLRIRIVQFNQTASQSNQAASSTWFLGVLNILFACLVCTQQPVWQNADLQQTLK